MSALFFTRQNSGLRVWADMNGVHIAAMLKVEILKESEYFEVLHFDLTDLEGAEKWRTFFAKVYKADRNVDDDYFFIDPRLGDIRLGSVLIKDRETPVAIKMWPTDEDHGGQWWGMAMRLGEITRIMELIMSYFQPLYRKQ
jgi:hypothetical protein